MDINRIITESINKILFENRQDARLRMATPDDYWKICELIANIEGVESVEEIDGFFKDEGGMDYKMTIVAENPEGEMVGCCSCSNGSIFEETPDMKENEPQLYNVLESMKYVMGLGFFIQEDYRGGNLARTMTGTLLSIAKSGRYDFIIVPVYRHLKTHNMYLHAGCIPFYVNNEDVIYYMFPFNKNLISIVNRYSTQPEVKNYIFQKYGKQI